MWIEVIENKLKYFKILTEKNIVSQFMEII